MRGGIRTASKILRIGVTWVFVLQGQEGVEATGTFLGRGYMSRSEGVLECSEGREGNISR